MPGPLRAGYELDQGAIATNEEMCGHLESAQAFVVRVRSKIESIREQADYTLAAEFPGRQADVVNDQKRDRGTRRALIEVRRRRLLRPGQDAAYVKRPERHSADSKPFHSVA